ncbi:HAMP domain-containing histidine kinase [Natronosporangium hydrolyticum]|uniref:histidine kinase n=1 Tax=Natronosporangium hydrolyticum TaxID=2811111 RepID=A0A895Y9H8_9ACTN|nr:HAMP domain-containing sensor histidine kinase [Natronosporangium hydrolyticum]QSB14397.1 HAMP domain-containing histidine kinase [Natronosporangium hydrolyticum]
MKRLTIRTRLTLVYGGLFLLAGALLLGVAYLLVAHSLADRLTVATSQDAYRVGSAETVDQGVKLAEAVRFAQDLQNAQAQAEAQRSLLIYGTAALAAVGLVAIGLGWVVAGRVLTPVHRITATARRIATGSPGHSLRERIGSTGPRDELRELADTFDLMLERLDRSFDGQRRFVANASHEIRTPLAVNRALLELAITRPDASQEVRELGESLLVVNARHERLIDGLLILAESEHRVVERSPVDLAEVVAHALDPVGGSGVEVIQELRPAETTGDPVLLERLVHNLVENAVRHNLQDGGWLSAATGVEDGYTTVTVANTGRVVPAYEVPVLFEPFRRASAADRVTSGGQDRGMGLGLSIARAVAQAHGGEVTATPREGGGLTVGVRLPAAASWE